MFGFSFSPSDVYKASGIDFSFQDLGYVQSTDDITMKLIDVSSLENIRREIIMLKQENQNFIEENSRLTLKFESLQRDNEMLIDKLHNIS